VSTIQAVYENGVFRPKVRVDLPDGQPVDLRFEATRSAEADEEYAAKLREAVSLRDLFTIIESEPEAEIDVDGLVDESRRASGFRMPDSRLGGAVP
jgi:predicted DNA-binding antitoxin AbrB/MazE fold protein